MKPFNAPEIIMLGLWVGLTCAMPMWARRRGRSGLAWFLLALFLSPLIAGFLLVCLTDLAEEKRKVVAHQISYSQQKFRQEVAEQAEHPASGLTHRVARNGEALGEYTISELRALIRSGEITLQDQYYDPKAATWGDLAALL